MMNESEFRETYLKVCKNGFSSLGHTVGETGHNEWQFKPTHPPSCAARGRFRFLKTLEEAKYLNPKRILEVGAGDGFTGACLYESDREILLNDLRPVDKTFGQWKNGSKLKFVQKNLYDLDKRDVGLFDLVLACEVIEHVAEGPRFVRHLKDMLAPGGHLLLTTPNGKYFRSKLPTFSQITDFKEFEARQFGPDSEDHLFLYTPTEIKTLLEETGFEQIKTKLSITPWISGHCGFRYLPSSLSTAGFYYLLDRFSNFLGPNFQEYFCTQLIVTAKVLS